jgi:hypothetical protein
MPDTPIHRNQPPSEPRSDTDQKKLVLDCHLAEYETLTSRITNWLTLQFATYAIAAAYLGFVIQAWRSVDSATLVWASTLVLQLLAWAMLQISWEVFACAVYIKKQLKPKIRSLVRDDSFWAYEHHMAGLRKKGLIHFEWYYGLLIPFFGAMGALVRLIIVLNHENPWTLPNVLWGVANLYAAAMLVGKARNTFHLQKQLGEQ